MKKSLLIKSLFIAATLPLLAGCIIYQQPPVAGAPPPQVEVVPVAPGPLDVWFWAPGEWVWRGQWVWVGGRWASRPHPGAVWVGGGWGWRGHHRVWVESHWR
jgi:hypothetical protein